ncbi:MAG: hypothetical protein WC405_19150 [Syntrophales bacterium]
MDITYMDKETLKAMLGDPGLLLIDVRAPRGWGRSTEKIKGAVRWERDQVAAWGPSLPRDKKIVLY